MNATGCGITIPKLAAERVRHGRDWTMIHAKTEDVLHRVGRFSHVITDPPYSARVHAMLGQEHRNDGRAERSALEFGALTRATARAVAVASAHLCDGWSILFGDEYTMCVWRTETEKAGAEWICNGLWHKPNALPKMSGDGPAPACEHFAVTHSRRAPGEGRRVWNGGGRHAFYTVPQDGTYSKARGDVKLHDTPKPLKLLLAMVADYTQIGEIVCDPFAGSAPVGEACLQLGRRYLGIECSRGSFDVAVERLVAAEAFNNVGAARRGQPSLFEAP